MDKFLTFRCNISSGFYASRITESKLFLTELLKIYKGARFYETQCTPINNSTLSTQNEKNYNLCFKCCKPIAMVKDYCSPLLTTEVFTDLHWAETSEFQLVIYQASAPLTALGQRRRTECCCICQLPQLLCWRSLSEQETMKATINVREQLLVRALSLCDY